MILFEEVVGASGFEPEASRAQGKGTTRNNCPVFRVIVEKQKLNRDCGMWLAVRNCP
jgi:hypothetical protein